VRGGDVEHLTPTAGKESVYFHLTASQTQPSFEDGVGAPISLRPAKTGDVVLLDANRTGKVLSAGAPDRPMKTVAGGLRLDLAQFRSLAAFAQFGSNLDKSTQAQLDRGIRLTELLKQGQYSPLSLAEQIALLYAGTNGFLDKIPVNRVKDWQESFLRAFNTQYSDIPNAITETKTLPPDAQAKLKAALTEFNSTWS
jgi:F0F1-type ATP synthase alpha subunit